MGEVDTFALLSSLVETHTQEIVSLKTTEPTISMRFHKWTLKTYKFCPICGVQGHSGYECSFNFYNSQNARYG